MRRLTVSIVVCLLGTCSCAAWGQDDGAGPGPISSQVAATAAVQPLSPKAMDALVAGIAFYPDAIIEQILDAAQYPDALKQAAARNDGSAASQSWPESIQALAAHREIVQQLDQNAAMTARLALAARTQLADLWRAVDRVRAAFEEQVEQAENTSTQSAVPVPYVYPTAAFVAGYWTAQVVDEMQVWYQATAAAAVVYGHGTTTITGPAGNSATVTGTGAAGQVKVGDTTYFGAAGTGTVTTSNGVVVQGEGQAAGTATQTENGGSYQTHASGSASSSAGQSGSGQHGAQGGYTVNPDGSVDFQRDAQTNISSTAGNSSIEHSGSGTVNPQTGGSYQGSTDIQSTHGDVSVNTSVADGQATSTLTTAQGQQAVTLGDGRVSTSPASSVSQRMARPDTVPAFQSRFSQADAGQWKPASQTLTDVWNRMNQTQKHMSRATPSWPDRSVRGTAVQPGFSRPGTTGPGSSSASPLKSFTVPQPPSRTRSTTPSRRRGGRR